MRRFVKTMVATIALTLVVAASVSAGGQKEGWQAPWWPEFLTNWADQYALNLDQAEPPLLFDAYGISKRGTGDFLGILPTPARNDWNEELVVAEVEQQLSNEGRPISVIAKKLSVAGASFSKTSTRR